MIGSKFMIKPRIPELWGLVVAVAVGVCDQITKAIVSTTMGLHETVEVVPGFFNLTYVRNKGAAFGIFSGHGEVVGPYLLILASFLAIGFLVWIWLKERPSSLLDTASLGLILGGAMGNLVDRVKGGEVIDFLDFHLGPYHWPAFNLADSAVTVGVLLFALRLMGIPKRG